MSTQRPYGNVAAVKADPELKFAAALIAMAIEDARDGDSEAYRWLEHCSPRWLYAITPDGDDLDMIHERLLGTVTRPEREDATA